jgi:AraC-like DNA-binding protein
MDGGSSASHPASLFRFSTDDYAAPERIDAWREVFGRTVVKVNIEPLQREGFHAEAAAYMSPGLGVLFATTSPVRQGNSHELISSSDLSFMSFGIGPDCRWSVSQLGRSPAVRPGDGVLLSNGELGSITFGDRCAYTTFCVPAAVMEPLVADLDGALVRPVPADNGALRLLSGYLALVRDTKILNDVRAQSAIATHVHDLLALALGATRDATELANGRGLRAARLRAIKSDLLRNPSRTFSVDQIAAAHHISPRYVQKLFEEEGTTFTEFVLNARLALAHRLLSDPASGGLVSSVALEVGFNDVSYFNRRFRKRYGCTPSDIRASAGEIAYLVPPGTARADTM